MNLDNLRRYGVEIEFIHPMNATDLIEMLNRNEALPNLRYASYSDKTNRWRIKPDASVHGDGYSHELVTPILKGEDDLQKLLAIVDVIEATGCLLYTSPSPRD